MNTDRFKFRVWYQPACDGIESRYFYDVESIYDGCIDGLGWISCFGDLLNDDQYIVEQCTGLTDLHGKLIYEGDVVKTKDFGKDIDNRINVNDYDTFVVKFHECGFYIENDSRRFPMSCRPKLEIIGNIHEGVKQ